MERTSAIVEFNRLLNELAATSEMREMLCRGQLNSALISFTNVFGAAVNAFRRARS